MESVFNQIVYFSFLQSIFLSFIYVFSPKLRKNINGYVAFLVFILMIGLVGRVLHISGYFGKDFRLIAFSEFATLLFGSTVYLFTKSSLLGKRFSYSDLRHYIPGMIYSILVVFVFMLPSDEEIGARIRSGELFRTISIFIGIGLVFNITYWVMSFQLFMRFKIDLNKELSYSVKTQFFQNFLIAIGICLACWVVVYFISLSGAELAERSARQFIWVSISLIILFIAIYGMREPELLRSIA